MPGRHTSSADYRYGFNGMEKDDEVKGSTGSSYDFGARMYDSRLGRWMSVDALSGKYPYASPYNYALNSPILAKDPDGNVVIFINGQHTGTTGPAYWMGHIGSKFVNFAQRVMDRIGDQKSLYFDGSSGGFSNTTTLVNNNRNLSAENRRQAGYSEGIANAQKIISSLKTDDNGKIIESVKIITHSMGGAYAKGFAQALQDYVAHNNSQAYLGATKWVDPDGNVHKYEEISGFMIEFEVDFANFQPNQQEAVEGVKTIQASHSADKVVNNKNKKIKTILGSTETKIKGVSDSDYHLNDDKSKGHSLIDFTDEIEKVVPKSENN